MNDGLAVGTVFRLQRITAASVVAGTLSFSITKHSLPMPYQNVDPRLVIEQLAPYLSDAKVQAIDRVLEERTASIVPVLDGILNRGNVHAVMRTAEGLGYCRMHIVDADGPTKYSPRVSMGAEKWLDVERWSTAGECISHLNEQGFRVVAADPVEGAARIENLDFSLPTAMVFGNERDGLSREMRSLCDQSMVLPVPGFMRSYNVSVAAGIALYHARLDRILRLGRHGDLSAEEKLHLKASYYTRCVRSAPELLRRLEQENHP
jgi:tRNA (guanosine-2'-O-)-methyltransferase